MEVNQERNSYEGKKRWGKFNSKVLVDSCKGKTKNNKRISVLQGKREFKMESIVFEKVEEKREMVKKTRKILEYNTVVLEDDTGSLKARQGKNMVWEDEEVGLIIF